MTRNPSRRSVVAGTGVAITGLLGAGSQVIADGHEIPVSIVSIDVEAEHIVLINEGDEDIDLSGYIVNYDWEGEQDQEDTIDVDDPDNAVIEAGGELVLHTGCTDIGGGDLMLGDFGNCQFDPYDDGPAFDTVALLSPDRNVVDTHSEDEQPEEEEEEGAEEEPDSWSSYYGTAGNTGSIAGDGAFPEPETLVWEHEESGHVAVADGRVYLRTGNEVHALDDSDGSVVWTSDELGAEDGIEHGTPAVAGETVVVGGGRLTALDATSGDVLWSREFDTEGGEAVTSPTVAFDSVFVVADETLHAFNLADGSLRWSRETVELDPPEDPQWVEWEGSREVTFVSTPAAVANEFVYAGVGHDDCPGFAAFDVLTGETQWTHTVDKSPFTLYDYHDSILATEDRIFTGSIAEELFPVLDAQTGEEVARAGHWFRPAVTDEVQVTVGRHGFSVQNYNTGDEWENSGGTDAWRRPAIAGETLIIPLAPWGTESAVYGFGLEDGTEQWRFTHPDVALEDVGDRHGFIVSGKTIYVTGGDQLQVLRPGPEQEEPKEEEDPTEEIREYEATLTGEAHDVETDASGYAYFSADSGAGEIEYSVEVDYLCDATQAHIHLGGADEDGPVVAWLYPEDGEEPELIEGRFDGVLADGTLTADDFVGEWEGATVEEAKAAFDEEEAYVNIHTEEHPGGEIRGQIEPADGS